jgi:hypothetical protein
LVDASVESPEAGAILNESGVVSSSPDANAASDTIATDADGSVLGSDASDAADIVTDFATFWADLIKARIARARECYRYLSPVDEREIASRGAAAGDQRARALAAGRVRFDPDKAANCLRRLRASCDDLLATTEIFIYKDPIDWCPAALVGQVAGGAYCGERGECADPNHECYPADGTCQSICGNFMRRHFVAEGEACGGNLECAWPTVCGTTPSDTMRKCRQIPIGAPCFRYGDCPDGVYCLPQQDSTNGKCGVGVGPHASCLNAVCAGDLTCVTHDAQGTVATCEPGRCPITACNDGYVCSAGLVCVPALDENAPCGPGLCKYGLECVSAVAGGDGGQFCQRIDRREGESCVDPLNCVAGTFCSATSRTCVKLRDLGQSCNTGSECANQPSCVNGLCATCP